jgi:transcription elongation GreA/GreB family factor
MEFFNTISRYRKIVILTGRDSRAPIGPSRETAVSAQADGGGTVKAFPILHMRIANRDGNLLDCLHDKNRISLLRRGADEANRLYKELTLSVAFTKEDSAETASEILLPDRPVSPHPNLVTETGLKALEFQLEQAREAYEAAQKIEDVNERRRQAAIPLRDIRYFVARVRTAQVVPDPMSTETVAFGSTVAFRRADGRVQKYRIVGEDEADPRSGSISFVSPVARLLMNKAVGDEAGASGQELEIISIS